LSDFRRNSALFLLAVTGMLIFVSLLGNFSATISAFQVELDLMIFDAGYTQLHLPPLGRVRARTHLPPLMLKAGLVNVNLDQLQQVLAMLKNEHFTASLRAEAFRILWIFLGRLLLLAFAGGIAAPFFFGERDKRRLLAAGLAGMLMLAALLGVSYATYQPLAFLNPEFEGILKAAPWMFGLLEETLFRVRSLGEQLGVIAANISVLFEQVERLEPLGTVDGMLKVAHISDLHNNPAGLDLVSQVIATFGVHLVIDTGDITDFGTQIEAEIASPIEDFGIPYVFIPGNHDSPEVTERLGQLENVTVIEEGIVTVRGLRIAGIADPSSRDTGMVVAPDPVLDDYGERLRRLVQEAEMKPHVAAAHHPRIAGAVLDHVDVILTGHTHQLSIAERGDSVLINAGTAGASGIRGLQVRRETPFSLVLLHFDQNEEGGFYLKAADVIRVFQFQTGFSLERRLFGSVSAPDPDLE
jgi:predicted phosphodiesterase